MYSWDHQNLNNWLYKFSPLLLVKYLRGKSLIVIKAPWCYTSYYILTHVFPV